MSTGDNEAALSFCYVHLCQSIKTMQPINQVIAHGKRADAPDFCYLVEIQPETLPMHEVVRLI